MHPFLEYFSSLPQFQASHLDGAVIHLMTGCTIWKYKSDEPKHQHTLQAHWPGQPRDEVCMLDGFLLVRIYGQEAKSLGTSSDDLARSMDRLKQAMAT